MTYTIKELQEEITRLRAALANSKDACVYCQLPAERIGECRFGFPGCARADDQVGCPEFGAGYHLYCIHTQLLTESNLDMLISWGKTLLAIGHTPGGSDAIKGLIQKLEEYKDENFRRTVRPGNGNTDTIGG